MSHFQYGRPYQKEQGALLPNQASRRVRCEPAAQFPTAELTATCEADRYLARFGPTHECRKLKRKPLWRTVLR
jgi:hypothetical protein